MLLGNYDHCCCRIRGCQQMPIGCWQSCLQHWSWPGLVVYCLGCAWRVLVGGFTGLDPLDMMHATNKKASEKHHTYCIVWYNAPHPSLRTIDMQYIFSHRIQCSQQSTGKDSIEGGLSKTSQSYHHKKWCQQHHDPAPTGSSVVR